MSESDRKQIGSKVRALRLAIGLTQEALAEKANLHPTYMGGIERGERNVGIDNIFKIAAALGVSVTELFEFEE